MRGSRPLTRLSGFGTPQMSARKYVWGESFYPGTDVLRNKLGIRDRELLTVAEESRTMFRAAQLARSPIEGDFDYRHFRAIHAYPFQDVYEWAGEERTAPDEMMTKLGPDVVGFAVGDPEAPMVSYRYFPAGSALTEHAEAQFAIYRVRDPPVAL